MTGDPADMEDALKFGRDAGLVREALHAAPPAPPSAPASPPAAAQEAPTPGQTAGPPPPAPEQPHPPPPTFMGQPAERVAMYAKAFLPGVETLADVARALGVDVTTPRKRVLFKGTPVEREIDADPVGRITVSARRAPS